MIQYFKNFQFTDLLAFGNILGVAEEDDFVEYVTKILDAFSKCDRKKRKSLLKLAKDVSKANDEMRADPNFMEKVKKKAEKWQ